MPRREIPDLIFSDENEANTLAGHQLRMLMDYSFENPDQPREHLNWLTRYAVDYRYSGTGFQMKDLDRETFQQEIVLPVHTFINRAQELTDTDASDLR